RITGRCAGDGYAVLRQEEAGGKVDVEVCDDSGRVNVRLQGLSTRELRAEREQSTVLLGRRWREGEVKSAAGSAVEPPERWVVWSEGGKGETGAAIDKEWAAHLEQHLPGVKCLTLRATA